MADTRILWTAGDSRDPTWDLITGFGGSHFHGSIFFLNVASGKDNGGIFGEEYKELPKILNFITIKSIVQPPE